MRKEFFPDLQDYIENINIERISLDRMRKLEEVIHYVQVALEHKTLAQVNFICTHNSRRSQFAQVWAHTAASFFDIPFQSYSAGVEVTACNPRTISALKRRGFISNTPTGDNPKYELRYSNQNEAVILFSKLYDASVNPTKDFAAIMTCSHADINCPIIPGTKVRIALNYEDPKAFDDTEHETEAYDKTCLEIATEMFYIFKTLKNGH
jgi:arsenate reductase